MIPVFTPIPDSAALAAKLALLLASSSPMAISAYLSAFVAMIGGDRRVSLAPITIYLRSLILLAILCFAWIGPAMVLPLFGKMPKDVEAGAFGTAVVVAPLLGLAAFKADEWLGRSIARREVALHVGRYSVDPRKQADITPASPWSIRVQPVRVAVRSKPQALFDTSPAQLAAIGSLEEVVMRGMMIVGVLKLAPATPILLPAFVALLWFPAAHIRFGRAQVLQKFPLSIVATALLLLGGTIPAAIAHGVYNLSAAQRLRNARVI